MTEAGRSQPAEARPHRHLDVVVIGAGFGGLYALYRFRQTGLSVQVYEAGSGIGDGIDSARKETNSPPRMVPLKLNAADDEGLARIASTSA